MNDDVLNEFSDLVQEELRRTEEFILDGQLDIRRYDHLAGKRLGLLKFEELLKLARIRVAQKLAGEDDAG